MKLIEYGKYKNSSPRSTILLLVVDAVVTGFFLGATLFEYLRGRGVMGWIWPLIMAFASAVGTLRATLVALHNCPPSVKTTQHETTPHVAQA
jgi:hypothetical protein